MGDKSKVTVAGQLAREPEMKYMDSGGEMVARTVVSIATNRKYRGVEEVTWHRITFWGDLAETVNKWCQKGTVVMTEGRLTPDPETGGPRVWHDERDGTWKASYEVTAWEITFLANLRPKPESTGLFDGGTTQISDLDDIPELSFD